MNDFYKRLQIKKPIIADGAMGTMLYSLGVPKGHCYDELNISRPAIVAQIHRAYAESGAEIIETNTFGANRFILDKYYDLGEKTFAINYEGARIAKANCPHCFIAGSVGPITRPLELAEKPSAKMMAKIFREQIAALVAGGVDLIILETFADLKEALIAFKTAQAVAKDKPIIVLFSFTPDGLTLTGVEPGLIAKTLIKAGAKIIGANCSSGPQGVFNAIKRMLPANPDFLCAMPNAGQVRFQQGRFFYPHNPDYFAYYAERFVQTGVSIIGGCCGTTPEHIKAMHKSLKNSTVRKPLVRIKTTSLEIKPRREKPIKSALRQKTQEKFVIMVEMETPRGINLDSEMEWAKELADLEIDAVSISDSPMAKVRMNPLPLAYRIKKEVGLDVILHITCRDRNLIGLQSDLLAAYALGIENILALTGDPPSVGDYPYTAVYEVTAKGLIEIAHKLNQGYDGLGNPLLQATGFWIGAGANGTAENLSEELARLKTKLSAGAQFIITQPVFDLKAFSRFLNHINIKKTPVFAGVMPLTNIRQAEYLRNEVPGITIPETLIKRLRQAHDVTKEGIAIASDLITQLKELVSGVLLMIPKGHKELLKKILGK
ncbi:MAG: bifunctional homocysteine S-methyltransferase/methylenetetrahydrofolate reductase [candidate division WOR-3 bacterium]